MEELRQRGLKVVPVTIWGDEVVRLQGRSYRMQHRRELRNLNHENTLTQLSQ